MNTIHNNTARQLLTALAAGLTALIVAAVACGPAAPDGQTGGDGADPTPTATGTPTPTPTTTLGTSPDDLPGLDSLLRARVAEHEAIQSSSQGASGQSAQPVMVSVKIAAYDDESGREIMDFITSNGATSVRNTGIGQSNIVADVPASILRTLSERTDISYMRARSLPYPKMNAGLNGLAVRYAAGLMPDEENDPTFARLVIRIDGSADEYDAIKRFLDQGGSVMLYGDAVISDAYKSSGVLVAFVPVRLFVELHGKPGILEIDHEQYPVPAEQRLTDYGEPGPTGGSVEDSSADQDGATGAAVPPPPSPGPTGPAGAVAHGADVWQSAGYRGEGIKMGIIDIGYDGYEPLIPSELPISAAQGCYRVLNRCLFGLDGFITNHGTAVAEAVIDIAPNRVLKWAVGPALRRLHLGQRRSVLVHLVLHPTPFDGGFLS